MNQFSSLQLKVNIIKEGKQVVIYAPALDISTVGNTEKQAKKRFDEMVKMYLKDIVDRKVVNEVLTELGWKQIPSTTKSPSQWMPPIVKSEDMFFSIAI